MSANDPHQAAAREPAGTGAHFIADLVSNQDTWQQWRRQMPVIYNTEPGGEPRG